MELSKGIEVTKKELIQKGTNTSYYHYHFINPVTKNGGVLILDLIGVGFGNCFNE